MVLLEKHSRIQSLKGMILGYYKRISNSSRTLYVHFQQFLCLTCILCAVFLTTLALNLLIFYDKIGIKKKEQNILINFKYI